MLLELLLCGCNGSTKAVAGGYALTRFDEGGTTYYLTASGERSSGGGVFDGTVQEIGWNNDWILARINRLYQGDTNGWYALNLKTRQVIGPIQESDLSKNSSFLGIKCRTPSDVFAGKN